MPNATCLSIESRTPARMPSVRIRMGAPGHVELIVVLACQVARFVHRSGYVPRPSSYPLLGPKYPELGATYPQLRVLGGSWYVGDCSNLDPKGGLKQGSQIEVSRPWCRLPEEHATTFTLSLCGSAIVLKLTSPWVSDLAGIPTATCSMPVKIEEPAPLA